MPTWIATRLDDEEIPVRFQWIVETSDGEMTIGVAEDGGIYIGFTEDDAEDIAKKLNGYVNREESIRAMAPQPKKKEFN